ncbi:MAG: ATPase, T2SS/T4P/T4SS family [Candidatus Bathyarchaeia archaeon]
MMELPLGAKLPSSEIVDAMKEKIARKGDPFKNFLELEREKIGKAFPLSALEKITPLQLKNLTEMVRKDLEDYNQHALSLGLPVLDGDVQKIVQEIIDSIVGLGSKMEKLLRDPQAEDIYIIGTRVWMKMAGGEVVKSEVEFESEKEVMEVIRRAMIGTGREVNRANPYADFPLPDGSRCHVIIEPCASPSPQVTIRKHRKVARTPEDLIKLGVITPEAMDFISRCVRAGVNMMVVGGTGVGKTTFLNVLGSLIPAGKMVVIMEDTPELFFEHDPPPRKLLTRDPQFTGEKGAQPVTLADLVKNALRMRPDYVLAGEVRGPECWPLVDMGQTGHVVMGSLHADDFGRAIRRLVNLSQRAAPDLKEEQILANVVGAIELIIVLRFTPKGERKVHEITEITGRIETGGVVTRNTIFSFTDGSLKCIGRPGERLMEKIKEFPYRVETRWV